MATHPASPTAGAGGDSSPAAPPPVHLSAALAVAVIQPTSRRYFFSSLAAASAAASSPHRRIGIAVDLSDESAFAFKWAVQNYLRPRDAVVLLHVRPTSVLYSADWDSIPVSVDDDPDADIAEGAARAAAATEEEPKEAKKKREEEFDAFTSTKAQDLAHPLVGAQIPFKIHIVKDHDMKERLCLENLLENLLVTKCELNACIFSHLSSWRGRCCRQESSQRSDVALKMIYCRVCYAEVAWTTE